MEILIIQTVLVNDFKECVRPMLYLLLEKTAFLSLGFGAPRVQGAT